MKTKQTKLYAVLAVFSFLLISLSGCTKKEYITEYYGQEYIETRVYTIKKTDWEWNSEAKRYECWVSEQIIDEDLYKYGTIVGTVYLREGDVDVQKTLPFVHTYQEEKYIFTETISFDLALSGGNKGGSIGFYIQASDLEDVFLTNYMFKVAYIWDSGESPSWN